MVQVQDTSRSNVYPLLVLIIASVVVFGSSAMWGFVYDDIPTIVENGKVKSLRYIYDFFTSGVWDNLGIPLEDKALYRPLFLVYISINYFLWGNNPFGYHVLNILLHIGNTCLLYLIMKELHHGIDRTFLLAAALIFAVHPVHVESVSWISGSTDLLMTLFFLLSFYFYLVQNTTGNSLYFFLCIACYLLSMLSKEPSIVFPVLICIYDYLWRKKIDVPKIAVLVVTGIFYVLLRTIILGKSTMPLSLDPEKILIFFQFFIEYAKKLLVPWPLHIYLKHPTTTVGAAVIFFVTIAGLSYLLRREARAFLPLGWYLLTLIPALALAFYDKPRFADRFLYLPSAGFVMLLLPLFSNMGALHRKATIAITALIIALYGITTVSVSQDWKNDEVFCMKLIREYPDLPGPYILLADYYERNRQFSKAIEYHQRLIDHTKDVKEMATAFDNIGRIYGANGFPQQSIKYFMKELELDPSRVTALIGLGNSYFLLNENGKAIEMYEKAFAVDRNNYVICFNLANIYDKNGNYGKAVQYYGIFLSIVPEYRMPDRVLYVQKRLKQLQPAPGR